MSETKLKIAVLRMIHKEFPTAVVYKTCDKFTSGIPDLLAWYYGKSFAIELKSKKGKATPLQLWFLNELAEQGVKTLLCYDVESARQLFRREVEK